MTPNAKIQEVRDPQLPRIDICEYNGKIKNAVGKVSDEQKTRLFDYLCRLTYSNALLVVDSADHLDAHFGDLWEVWLLKADVSEDLDHSLPHTDSGVLSKENTLDAVNSDAYVQQLVFRLFGKTSKLAHGTVAAWLEQLPYNLGRIASSLSYDGHRGTVVRLVRMYGL